MVKSFPMKKGLNRFLFLTSIFLLTPIIVRGQEENTPENLKKWELNGYIKDMVSLNFTPDSTLVDNLIHNRLNFKWYPNENLSIVVEMRNRIFTGDLVKSIPQYSSFIDTNNDYFDLSVIPLDKNNLVMHSMIDRAYVEWTNEHWEIRAGRQRINWGTNVVWNPNDLFNAYSFFDFDYEERPGSDALRVTKYIGFASSVEVAVKMADHHSNLVAAGLWKFNQWNYDFQLLSGVANGDFTLGAGWAGNIGNAGFKGEMTYFTPYENTPGVNTAFLGAFTVDYSFGNSSYLLGSYLFNSDGVTSLNTQSTFLLSNQTLTARNLMPFRHSTIIQYSYQVHPLINTSLAIMNFPGDNALFINPGISMSMTKNLDLSLISQFFLNEDINNDYKAIAKLLFTRIKWSF